MSEANQKPEIVREHDPLGFLIIPIFGVILVAVVLLWINQKKDEKEQRFFPVTGLITLNNKPLEGRFQISFFPANDSDSPIASALIEKDGTYELTSGSRGIKGAMPGEYRVSVVMLEENDQSFRMQGTDPDEIKINPKDGGTVVPPDPDPPFNKIFSDPKKTPQRAIVGKTDNRIDIDLPPPSKTSTGKKKGRSKKTGKDGEGGRAGQVGKKNEVSRNKPAEKSDKSGSQSPSLNQSKEATSESKKTDDQ